MLQRLAHFLVLRRKRVLVGALVAFFVAGGIGGSVAKHMSAGGFEDPSSESAKATRILQREFGQGEANLVLLVTAKDGNVDSPAVATVGKAITDELGHQPGVTEAASYWSLGSPPPLKSKNGNEALVIASIAGSQNDVADRIKVIAPKFERNDVTVGVRVGGFAQIFHQVSTQIEKDLTRAEMIAFPITLFLLVLVFGGVIAAALPLAIGILAVVGTFLILRVMTSLTEVSIFSLNLATGMGLGLAIDYSLFIVSRFREELRNGLEPNDAIVRTVETAGRTVLISALTVAASLSALLIFPLAFLRSFAYSGIGVVVTAAAGAILVLPAMLAVLGRRIDSWQVFHRPAKNDGEGFWHRMAVRVMRRPVGFGAAVILILFLLGSPFLHIRFSLPDDRVLPKGATSRQVQQDIRDGFSAEEVLATTVVARGATVEGQRGDVDAYAARLSTIPNVARVDAGTGSYIGGKLVVPPGPTSARFGSDKGTWFSVVSKVDAMSPAAEKVVKQVRATQAPFAVQVGGPSAQLVDEKASLFGRMPLAIGIIAVATFVLLFLMFGSILVPVKALILNALSLTATFGAMVWIFQDGHLAHTLSFTPTGALDTTTPILMFCIAFGLSMDYEVFLLSRIKEEHDRTGDNVQSVAVGLERTGGIVTAAAGLLAVVFLAFATSGITFIKLFGIGLTMAVVMDATLIRATLVPAFMRLAGEANWWAPRALRKVYARWGIHEVPEPAVPVRSAA
jgi:RND superfamily putative drug exporter